MVSDPVIVAEIVTRPWLGSVNKIGSLSPQRPKLKTSGGEKERLLYSGSPAAWEGDRQAFLKRHSERECFKGRQKGLQLIRGLQAYLLATEAVCLEPPDRMFLSVVFGSST